MTTFLWMLYLALTIFNSIFFIIHTIEEFKRNSPNVSTTATLMFLISILWSIWYFYYLN